MINKQNNMHKTKKLGFTLAELTCTLAIVGICTALAMTTIKPNSKITKYGYMNAYQTLEKAYYNAMITGYNPFLETDSNNRPIIHENNRDSGAKIICQGLNKYINKKKTGSMFELLQDDNFFVQKFVCSDNKLTDVSAENSNDDDNNNNKFDKDNIIFEAANNYRFYITKQLSDPNNDNFKFYIVFIDINGAKKPNSITYTYKLHKPETAKNRIDPDIFAFALLDNGRICPLGIPEYDKNIMAVGVSYSSPNNENNTSNYTDRAFTLMEAKSIAWGYYSMEKNPENSYAIDENLSMNDYIRSLLPKGCAINEGFPANYDTFENFPIANAIPYNCIQMDYEQCSVFPFTYHR